MDVVFDTLYTAMTGAAWLALVASFGWGLLSILLSPCHLSSIPLIVGFISSQGTILPRRTLLISIFFSSGILLTILLIGLITAALGRMLGDVGSIGNYLVSGVFFLVGLYLMDILKLNWRGYTAGSLSIKGYPAAFVLGLLFGLGVGPCTFAFMAPVLGVVLDTAQSNVFFSTALLSAFAFGHCILIIIAGIMTGKVQQYLNWTMASPVVTWVKRVCGVLVILGGVYLLMK